MFAVRGTVALLLMAAVVLLAAWSVADRDSRGDRARSSARESTALQASAAARAMTLTPLDVRARTGSFPSSRSELGAAGSLADGFSVDIVGSASDFSVRVSYRDTWFMGYVDFASRRVAATCSAPAAAGCPGGGWDLASSVRWP